MKNKRRTWSENEVEMSKSILRHNGWNWSESPNETYVWFWFSYLRYKCCPKASSPCGINTIIHVCTQSTTYNNIKWIANTLHISATASQLTKLSIHMTDRTQYLAWHEHTEKSNLYHNISWFVFRQSSSALSNNTPEWFLIFTTRKTTNCISTRKEKRCTPLLLWTKIISKIDLLTRPS
jgi:hypothetical protein